MTDERYQKIMADLGMPNSHSLLSALRQVANEVSQAAKREACAKTVEDRGVATKNGEYKGNNHAAGAFADCIRERSNAGAEPRATTSYSKGYSMVEHKNDLPHLPHPYAWRAIGGTIWSYRTCESDTPMYTDEQMRDYAIKAIYTAHPMTDTEYKNLTGNGAKAWAGVDSQKLRTGDF